MIYVKQLLNDVLLTNDAVNLFDNFLIKLEDQVNDSACDIAITRGDNIVQTYDIEQAIRSVFQSYLDQPTEANDEN